MSKGTRFVVMSLFAVTLALGVVAFGVSSRLQTDPIVDPEERIPATDDLAPSCSCQNYNDNEGCGTGCTFTNFDCQGVADQKGIAQVAMCPKANRPTCEGYVEDQVCFGNNEEGESKVGICNNPISYPSNNECGKVCEPGGSACSGGLSCAPDFHCSVGDEYKDECNAPGETCGPNASGTCQRVCWGDICGTSTPPPSTPPETMTPTPPNTSKSCNVTHSFECLDDGNVRVSWDANAEGFEIDNTDGKVIVRIDNTKNGWIEEGDIWWATDFDEFTGDPTNGSFEFEVEQGQEHTVRVAVDSPANEGEEICTTSSPTFTCGETVDPVCGDDVCDTGEMCDGTKVCPSGNDIPEGQTCRAPGEEFECTYCGDGVVQGDEECDDTDRDVCTDQCTFVPVDPPEVGCGNNECDPGEMCDGTIECPSGQTLGEGLTCRPLGSEGECTYCGDGSIQPGEECDDGDTIDTNDCSNSCKKKVTPTCSNTVCDAGETCSFGSQTICSGGGQFTAGECRSNCTYCGDGVKQIDEQCDDGNTNNNDSCNNSCQTVGTPSVCGDGILNPSEECETGIANSCGPGAVCITGGCFCRPTLPGLCGSGCNTNSDCPSDNSCFAGRCRLSVCQPGLSQPLSASLLSNPLNASLVCTSNGCEVIACGTTCGAGGLCPIGLSCNRDGRCVLPYCVGNKCQNACELPPTALISDEVDMMLLAILAIMIGMLAYRMDLGLKTYGVINGFGETKTGSVLSQVTGLNFISNLLKTLQSKLNERHYKKRTKEEFEDRF